jgi:hypothetical protein
MQILNDEGKNRRDCEDRQPQSVAREPEEKQRGEIRL